ncbi:hypothetical protein [Saccharothrix sp. HUAS TT1]|uniref:hypothetical protein n=1 Tax=unclassified Saccharothrix TaxID=2593673 RepID=UPI00345B7C44
MQEPQEKVGAADEAPHPPFHVSWSSVHHFQALIDPALPEHAGLTPADFPRYDTEPLSDEVDTLLEDLETGEHRESRDGREVSTVVALDGIELGDG